MTQRMRALQRTYKDWKISTTRGGHIRLKHKKTGKVLFTPATPSDWRGDKNLRSTIRRYT